jgi:nucleolysin TIA-1/TIAR
MISTGIIPNSIEDRQRKLYVGNLDPRVTEHLLFELFSNMGQIEQCKIIVDKTTGQSAGYGFVDFVDRDCALRALQTMNQRTIYDQEIRVNWAFQGTSHQPDSHPIYVGDLSKEVDDAMLYKAFSPFGECVDARVMWDPDTGRSRGYGFVTFRVRQNAERAFQEMNGSFLGGRAIKVNWANNKKLGNEPETADPGSSMKEIQSGNRVVYVGNLGPEVTSEALQLKFRDIGPLESVKVTPEKGYAFVTYQTASDAARAIETFNGDYIGNRPMKCGWGKMKDSSQASSQVITPTMVLAQQMGVSPQQLASYMNAGYMPNLMQYPYAYPGGVAANPQLQMQQQYQQQIPLQQQVPLQQQLYQQQLLQQQQMQMQMQQPQQQSYNPQAGYTPVAGYNSNYTASYPHNSGHP